MLCRIVASVAALLTLILPVAAQTVTPPGEIEIIDHTLAPLADDLPEALRELYLPEGALDDLRTVFESADEAVREVQVGWLGGDRYLWRIVMAEPPAEGEIVGLYLDADGNPATGRQDAGGNDLMLQVGPDRTRQYQYMPDGRGCRARPARGAVDGATVWLTYDYPLARTDGGVAFRFWASGPGGGISPQSVELSLGHAKPMALSAPEPLQTLVAELAWQRVDDGRELLVTEHVIPRDGYLSRSVSTENLGARERWLDVQMALPMAFEGDWKLFDGFNFTPHESPATDTIYSGISAMLPLTCAWDGETGIALALNPWTRYSELHAGARVGDAQQLLMGSRLAISPGEADSLDFVVFAFDGATGWRGAFSRYWQLFPDAYDRPRDIDPRFHMTSAGGLYWSCTDSEKDEFAPDLIRRLHAGWTWGYAPAPRPGEWAISEKSVGEWTRSRGTVKKSLTAESLPDARARARDRCDGDKANVAVAYYMHLKCVEQGLVNQYWSDSHTNDEPSEYFGYYQFVPCFELYPWADSYGEYMRGALPSIAESFEPAGMAFDSVFGFIPEYGKAALRTPATTFENGRAFVCEGIGWSMLQDVVRKQTTRGHRTAMVTNLKLPTTSSNAVRTDSALLEFGPTENPNFMERILRLRMMSGRIMFTWWHTLDPHTYKWLKWDEYTSAQKLDALRRIRDDLLIHSMHYGALPNGRYLVGLPKLIKAVPMLTEMFDLGWDPLIAAEPLESDLLVSRYGSGLGMAYGLGNQSYDTIEDQLVVDLPRVSDEDLVYMDYNGAPSATTFADNQARVAVKVKPRNVAAVRAVLELPRGVGREIGAYPSGRSRGPSDYMASLPAEFQKHTNCGISFHVICAKPGPSRVRLWCPPDTWQQEISLNGETVAYTRDGDALVANVDLKEGKNSLSLFWEPKIIARETALLNRYDFVADGRANCSIVAPESARSSAMRVQHFFREYYRWAADEPADIRLPIVTPDQDTGGRRIWIGVKDDLPEDLHVDIAGWMAGFGVDGDTVYAVARDESLLDETVLALLETLDEKYEYWGPLSITHYFFREDMSSALPVLVEAGIAGRYLDGEDTGSLPDADNFPLLPSYP